MYTPRDLNYEPLYAVATFLSPLQCNDLSEPEKKIARDYLKGEVRKLGDYMGEKAIETNDNIGVVEDHEEVYIPGAGRLGKLNNHDLRDPKSPERCMTTYDAYWKWKIVPFTFTSRCPFTG